MQRAPSARRPTPITIEVAVGPLTPTGYALNVRGAGGEAQSRLVLPTADPDYLALVERLASLMIDADALAEIGRTLFNTLFQGEARDVYRATQALRTEDQRLRIVLAIPADAAPVAALPWEFLVDPATPGALAMRGITVVRYLPQPTRVPALATALPLRMLLTAAQTPPQIDVERELAAIQVALSALGRQIHVTIERHLTVAILQDQLRAGYHIWHFVGHGSTNAAGTRQLAFEDATGDVEYVTIAQLGALLSDSGVRLVVLNACHAAQIGDELLQSLAPALVVAGVPAVVAMQFAVPAESARAFAAECYEALAAGLPIDACVTEGRKAVLNAVGEQRPDWGIPVVITRAQTVRWLSWLAGQMQRPQACPRPQPSAIGARCWRCGSTNLQKNGHTKTGQQKFHCKDCNFYGTLDTKEDERRHQQQTVERLHQERLSQRAIARITGMSRNTIAALVKKKS